MDFTPLLYLKTPKEAFASVSAFKIIQFWFSVFTMSAIFMVVYIKLVDKVFRRFESIIYQIPAVLFFIII
jgi:hypothetical protein